MAGFSCDALTHPLRHNVTSETPVSDVEFRRFLSGTFHSHRCSPLFLKGEYSMLRFIFGAFVVLHGLVHLLYAGQSQRLFELVPGMLWPDGSWMFTRPLGDVATRSLASTALVLAALGLAAGGAGLLVKLTWWRPLVIGAAALSAVLYVLFWDGQFQRLPDKGGIGILISVGILIVALLARWPGLDS